MSRNVGHIQSGEHVFGGLRIVVSGAAHQGAAGQRDQRIDSRATMAGEVTSDGRPCIKARCAHRNHPQATRFERCDHAVVVARIAGQQVGAQQQQSDRAIAGRRGQTLQVVGKPGSQMRVVHAHFGICDGRRGALAALQSAAGSRRIAADEKAHHVEDVVLGTRQPVLQRQKVGAHILRRARDEAQELRNPPQHFHLIGARGAAVLFCAAQPAQQCERPALAAVHAEAAHAGQPHDLGRRHGADHGVAALAPGTQRLEQRLEVVLHEQHGDDDDIAPRDVVDAELQGSRIAAPFIRGVHRE